MLHQFYEMEPYPSISFVTDEKSEPLNISPSLVWAQIISDTSLKLIAIPGDHFSLLENDENKIVLVQALDMALVISYEGEVVYTRYLSSCLFVGYTRSPQSHSLLCSRGFTPLPSRCILKSIGYRAIYLGNIVLQLMIHYISYCFIKIMFIII
ncbi:hypothetical protein SAMN02982990_03684 [Photorhabdus luminescens]|uniref:Uncharacterized protein n=1 Tax=Photorhabdus luminescens TaxID=29488 RepID=A0A1G5RCV9_PHOLU|nr:hypothetical protein SAMN02982990_03684 [Photorhabdus luminescens]